MLFAKKHGIIFTSKTRRIKVDKRIFTLKRIEGEYAYLSDNETGEELFIALALLPAGVDEGTVIACENMEFFIV